MYPKQLLHQEPFIPYTFQIKHHSHQTPCAPTPFYTRQLLHQTRCPPNNFYTRRDRQKPFTPNTFYTDFYTREFLHQSNFFTRHLLHQKRVTRNSLYTQDPLKPNAFYTKHLLLRTLPPSVTSFFPQPGKPKSRAPFFRSKNWNFYFSLVCLFWAPRQRYNQTYTPSLSPKHVIPYLSSCISQPAKPKSKVPYFSQKQFNSTLNLQPRFYTGNYMPRVTCFFPQPGKPKSRAPFLKKKLEALFSTGLPLLEPPPMLFLHLQPHRASSFLVDPSDLY